MYLFLKASDFVLHDLDPSKVFDGCVPAQGGPAPHSPPAYQLELVLKRWYLMETSRELRCFVRDNHLTGIIKLLEEDNFAEFVHFRN